MGRRAHNLYRRPDKPGGTYYIDVFIDGKRRRQSLKTKVEKEAKDIRDKIQAGERELKGSGRGRDITPQAFWKHYSEWATLHRAKRSTQRWGQFWNAFLDYAKPEKLGQVSRTEVENFKAHCVTVKKWQPKTVNSAIEALCALYNHATKLGLYSKANPFSKVARLPIPQKMPKFLSKDEVNGLLDAAEKRSREVYLFVALCAYAGLRNKEAGAARWEWVDFDRNCITVPSSQGEDFRTKNSRFRTIPLHDRLRAILEPKRKPEGFIVHPEIVADSKKRVRYDCRAGFRAAAIDAGLPSCTPHLLRHTFASHLVMSGVSIYKVSMWLGHSKLATTAIYAHLAPSDSDINRF